MGRCEKRKIADLAKLAWEAAVATRNLKKPAAAKVWLRTATPQLLKRG